MTAKVFISYRRDDARYQASKIHKGFSKAVGQEHVFMDIDSIPPGANFRKLLKQWVDECQILLALIGPSWIDTRDPRTDERRLDNPSDFVRIEIGEALNRDIPVVPVLLDGTSMPDRDLLPEDLKELIDRQAEFIEFRTFDADVQRLIRKLGLEATETDSMFKHNHAPSQPSSVPLSQDIHKSQKYPTIISNHQDSRLLSLTGSASGKGNLTVRRSEVAEHVKKILIEHLAVEDHRVIENASLIDDLGADSLDLVELTMAIEEEFGCEVPDNAAEYILTVGDVIKILEQNAKY